MSKIRVLHAVGSLAPGGVETWLVQVLRRIDRRRFQMDFLTLFDDPQAYDREVRELGSTIVHCPGYRQPWRFAYNFWRIVRQHGPYDILHCHFQEYSGFLVWLAAQAGIPVRIVHSHSDLLPRWMAATAGRRVYMRSMQALIRRYATERLAVSGSAAHLFVDAVNGAQVPWQAHLCGIDLGPFAAPYDAAAIRAELGIASQSLVIGHVGRFVALKNHRRLLEILDALLAGTCDAALLLVGDGPERATITHQTHAAGLAERVIFAGARPDVARMLAAMDVFVLPSQYEGLGLAAVEAQAAGRRCLLSDRLPPDAVPVPELVQCQRLDAPVAQWAAIIRELLAAPPAISPPVALARVQQAGFAIESSIAALEALYTAGAGYAGRN